jgi:hypothetical protein
MYDAEAARNTPAGTSRPLGQDHHKAQADDERADRHADVLDVRQVVHGL